MTDLGLVAIQEVCILPELLSHLPYEFLSSYSIEIQLQGPFGNAGYWY